MNNLPHDSKSEELAPAMGILPTALRRYALRVSTREVVDLEDEDMMEDDVKFDKQWRVSRGNKLSCCVCGEEDGRFYTLRSVPRRRFPLCRLFCSITTSWHAT